MNFLCKKNQNILILLFFFTSSIKLIAANNTESITVKHYDDLSSSLPSEISSKLGVSNLNTTKYGSFFAKNNGSISGRNKKNDADTAVLSTTTFENKFAVNSTFFEAPTAKNTMYELLTRNNGKEYFPEIAFLDANTLVTISFSKQGATLLFIDVSNSQMKVTSKISVPVDKNNTSNKKEFFYIDPISHTVVIPVNKGKESISNGELSWKKNKTVTPGIWIVHPVKNDEKKWSFGPSSIEVKYFYSNDLSQKGKNALQVQTAHADTKGNIWLSFNNGIIGVLANESKNEKAAYSTEIQLYNFNKDASWYSAMKKDYSTLLYENLKGSVDPEVEDTTNLQKRYFQNPNAFSQQYLENAKYAVFSNILREKNNELDSNSYYENSEQLMQYVNLELDDPLSKKKNKTVDYFGFKVKQFQTIQNSITSGNEDDVYITTNLGLHKLFFNTKTNSVQLKWSLPYKNSFIKETGNKVAASQSTPTFIEEKNEIVFCDNDFPVKNLMILDAATGKVKHKFALFEYAAGSANENAAAYANNTILASNTFGNGINGFPAKGVMKFNCTETGTWMPDYVWNKLHVNTIGNTAAVKIAAVDDKAFVYQKTSDLSNWQFGALQLSNVTEYNKISYSLTPDFKGVVKVNLNNNKSNFTIGAKKSLFIGTSNGLLRIISE